jgi:signal transduction histidine kinase
MVGSSIATFLEVAMIMRLSNKIDERLIKTNHELDNFVYSVSHDLRSPLMSVRGLIMLIKERPIGDKVAMDYLELADRSINSLDDTIREILDYSRNSRLETQSDSFEVVPLVDQIFRDLQYVSEEVFSFQFEPADVTQVQTDRSRLNTVLRNVIGNSVKYRKTDIPDPYVKVRFERDTKGIVFTVEDNGEGIPSDKIDRVYDMFYRGSNTGQGTGLGLYICREILQKLGGHISLTSEFGKGTVVRIFIPQYPAA